MSKIESKIGQILLPDEKIFNFLSDFNNFKSLIPADRVKNWTSTADACSFTVDGIGDAGLKIIERSPFKLIKITSEGKTPVSFMLWIQLKKVDENRTDIRIVIEPEVNPFMYSIVKGPLQGFVDMLIDQVVKLKL